MSVKTYVRKMQLKVSPQYINKIFNIQTNLCVLLFTPALYYMLSVGADASRVLRRHIFLVRDTDTPRADTSKWTGPELD